MGPFDKLGKQIKDGAGGATESAVKPENDENSKEAEHSLEIAFDVFVEYMVECIVYTIVTWICLLMAILRGDFSKRLMKKTRASMNNLPYQINSSFQSRRKERFLRWDF